MPTFVLNDESVVNSYGFRTLNKGIDLKRFKANPVLLDQHYNSTSAVLGRFKNIRIEGTQLLADSEFDSEDDKAKAIEGKVDRGFIKGVSMGISFNRDNMVKNPDGTFELTKCELYEGSIVAIPSNSNSLKLYSETGELMDEKEIQLSLKELQTNPITNKNTSIMKLSLMVATMAALGIENTEDLAQVQMAIEKMVKDNAELKAEKTALESKLTAVTEATAKALVDKAIADGKLTADLKDSYVKMAVSDFEAVSKTLAALPSKETLGDKTQNTEVGAVKTQEDFQNLTLEQQLAWKDKNPTAYETMFKA